MSDSLEALQQLQLVETQLAEIRSTQESKQNRVETCQRQVAALEEQLRDKQTSTQDRKAKIDALDLEMTAYEESIAKQRAGLNSAETNKEHDSILLAMNRESAVLSQLETRASRLSWEIGVFEREAATVETRKSELLQKLAEAQQRLRATNGAYKRKVVRLKAKREECSRRIDPKVLGAFERVAEKYGGEGMAALVKRDPRREEYGCSGCNMQVTLEVVNVVRTHDEIPTCNVCGRILYLDDDATQ